MTTQPRREGFGSILAIPGRTVSPTAKVMLAFVLCLPGCAPWAAKFGRSLLANSPTLYAEPWATIMELLYLGAVVGLLTTPMALVLLVRHGRAVSPVVRSVVWALALAACAGPLYVFAGALGLGL